LTFQSHEKCMRLEKTNEPVCLLAFSLGKK
jgi:hypothetical protein